MTLFNMYIVIVHKFGPKEKDLNTLEKDSERCGFVEETLLKLDGLPISVS